MDPVALLLALATVICFLLAMSVRARSQAPFWVPLGLALLTVAWICQMVHLTHHHWTA